MHRLGTTAMAADALLAALERNLPGGSDAGTPVVMVRGVIVVDYDGALGLLRADAAGVHRYLPLPDGRIELTGYRRGKPTYQHVVSTDPPTGGS